MYIRFIDSSAADSSEPEKQQISDRTLILVRHGQYDFNTGQLTALGKYAYRLRFLASTCMCAEWTLN